MICLMNILSSYPAIYELLAKKPLPSKQNYSLREVPSNMVVSMYFMYSVLCVIERTVKICENWDSVLNFLGFYVVFIFL